MRKSKKLHRIIGTFIRSVQAIPFDAEAASRYGKLAAELEMSGSPIGSLDALIAAHALSAKATLVTNNLKHFGRVRGLKVVTWL